jgi:hypothetical protein
MPPHVFKVKPMSCPSNFRPETLLVFAQKSEGFAGDFDDQAFLKRYPGK